MLRIHPTLRRCWRDVGRVQLGADPAHAQVLDGLTAGDEALLDDLVDGVAEADLAARAATRGVPAGAAVHLVGLLATAGALEPPSAPGARAAARATAAEARTQALVRGAGGWDVLARRGQRRVVVEGSGRVPAAVGAGLVEAGVGRVEHHAPGGSGAPDLRRHARTAGSPPHGPRRSGRSGAEAVRSAAGSAGAPRGATEDGAADLVVLVVDAAAPPTRGAQLLRADADHLAVVLRERSAVVGPLVVPGRSACLRCLDLHRTDRDPEWPRVAAQLAHPATVEAPPDVVLLRLTAALAVAQVLAHLDALAVPARTAGVLPDGSAGPAAPGHELAPPWGAPEPPSATAGTAAAQGRTWELSLPDGLPVGREWPPHPACGCTWPPP